MEYQWIRPGMHTYAWSLDGISMDNVGLGMEYAWIMHGFVYTPAAHKHASKTRQTQNQAHAQTHTQDNTRTLMLFALPGGPWWAPFGPGWHPVHGDSDIRNSLFWYFAAR